MKSVKDEEIQKFLEIYNKQGSLREVSRKTGRSINTIKKYLKEKIKLNLRKTIISANISDDVLIGTYVGLWMGDGTQYYDQSYVVKFCSNKKQKDLNLLIQDIIKRIFNKESWLIEENNNNRAYIKLRSKYIYEFINEYCYFNENKTLSVCLKEKINHYSEKFIEGVLLGLALSDGYLKKRFKYNSISKKLSNNVNKILLNKGFTPKTYIHERKKWKWHDLYMISLGTKESKSLLKEFDITLQRLGSNKKFQELKSGPAEI